MVPYKIVQIKEAVENLNLREPEEVRTCICFHAITRILNKLILNYYNDGFDKDNILIDICKSSILCL